MTSLKAAGTSWLMEAISLVMSYAADTTGTPAHAIDLAQLDAALIGGFLAHLEGERGNSIATRNARLAAVHSLFAYAAVEQHPEHAGSINRAIGPSAGGRLRTIGREHRLSRSTGATRRAARRPLVTDR